MTFYNYIEDVRHEMFSLVNSWTRKGAETKARISENLDKAREEYMQTELENAKLQKLAHDLLQPILAAGFDCYGCVHEDCKGRLYTDKCKLLDRACKLGVEVE